MLSLFLGGCKIFMSSVKENLQKIQEKIENIRKNIFELTKERKRYILSNDAAIMLGEMSPKILNNEIAQIHLSCKN